MALAGFSEVERLTEEHDLSRFDCGKLSLDDWLRRFALINDRNDSARTYVVHRHRVVLGYYSLDAGSVVREEATARVAKGLARHPIPVAVLARLAVDLAVKGSGLGAALLKDALLRVHGAADVIGIRAILVHAIDPQARSFYRHFEFEPFPTDDLRLLLLMKDLRENLRK